MRRAGGGPGDGPGRTRRHDGAAAVQKQIGRWQFRRLAVRVLLVQIVALAALWLLQSTFGGS